MHLLLINPNNSTSVFALIGACAAAQRAAEHHARADAVIVAAFGDPGLGEQRAAGRPGAHAWRRHRTSCARACRRH